MCYVTRHINSIRKPGKSCSHHQEISERQANFCHHLLKWPLFTPFITNTYSPCPVSHAPSLLILACQRIGLAHQCHFYDSCLQSSPHPLYTFPGHAPSHTGGNPLWIASGTCHLCPLHHQENSVCERMGKENCLHEVKGNLIRNAQFKTLQDKLSENSTLTIKESSKQQANLFYHSVKSATLYPLNIPPELLVYLPFIPASELKIFLPPLQ